MYMKINSDECAKAVGHFEDIGYYLHLSYT